MNGSLYTEEQQHYRDNEHLKILSIFHFIVSGLALLGIGFLAFHYLLMGTFFQHPERWAPQQGGGPPPEFFRILIFFYVLMAGVMLTASVCNLLSGIFLIRRRYRLFSLVVAGLDCLQVPFGTILGVFTILVLLRDSVRQSYEPSAMVR
jgi:hypothetical protein